MNLIPLAYGDQHALQKQALFLYDLLKEREPVANISHKSLPPFWKHLEFINSRPYAVWNIIECFVPGPENLVWAQIGSVYLTGDRPGFLGDEIGIFLSKEFQGRGYGRQAVRMLMEQNPRPRYLANIAPDHLVSREFFNGLGFRPLQVTYQLEAKCAD